MIPREEGREKAPPWLRSRSKKRIEGRARGSLRERERRWTIQRPLSFSLFTYQGRHDRDTEREEQDGETHFVLRGDSKEGRRRREKRFSFLRTVSSRGGFIFSSLGLARTRRALLRPTTIVDRREKSSHLSRSEQQPRCLSSCDDRRRRTRSFRPGDAHPDARRRDGLFFGRDGPVRSREWIAIRGVLVFR